MYCGFFRTPSVLSFLTATLCLIALGKAEAAPLVNSDFTDSVNIIGDVTHNPITNLASGEWHLGGNDNSDRWEVTGGVAVNVGTGSEAQGMLQFVMDNKGMTGTSMLNFDLNADPGSGDFDLHLYVFGWNDGDNVPGVDFENGTAGTGDSFIPDDSVNLITDPTGSEGRLVLIENGSVVFPGIVLGSGFQSLSVDLDFGSGYDKIGVLFYGENSGGTLEIDNVQFTAIPEPSSLAVFGLATITAGYYLRRRKRGTPEEIPTIS